MNSAIELPLYCCPPISWFVALVHAKNFYLSKNAAWRKQHYYNRYFICGPNNIQQLTIPVQKTTTGYLPLSAVFPLPPAQWFHQHRKSLQTAYARSPFFEYYIDEFLSLLYPQPTDTILDINLRLINFFLTIVAPELTTSSETMTNQSEKIDTINIINLEPAFDPRRYKFPYWFSPQKYYQNFGDFLPDLSILDLIMQKGPYSIEILTSSLKT